MKLEKIAELIGGSLKGDGSMEISGVCSIEEAGEGQITYITKKKHLDSFNQSKASAVIVEREIETDKPQVVTPNPALAFARILNTFHPEQRPGAGVDSRAAVGKNVKLGKNVTLSAFVTLGENVTVGDESVIHPGVVVGDNCSIGNHSVLYPNVTLYADTDVGDHVILHAGVVVGADGFGYALDEKGRHYKIRQIGRVVIEDHVEVGANTCIDRASLGVTRIKQGTKIDNLVQVAHNCSVGEHSILVAQVGLAGSCTLGHHVVLAGQVGLVDHVTLGDQVTLAARAAALRDIEDKGVYGGAPTVPFTTWKKYVTILPKLPELARKVKALDNRLNALEKK